ncbi:MAG: sigma-54 dependent transcriptional regulator [Mariniblastus sp.]|nr:sigma-54 dependent transcriptional regulator [Mariniblastus sp.]
MSTVPKTNILIADDDPVTRLLFKKYLENAEFEVITAVDGSDALRQMTQDVTLAVLDLNMPKLSGVDCIRKIRKKFSSCEVLIVSGVGQIHDAVHAMKEGACEFITKPCDPDAFIAHVKSAIRTSKLAKRNQQLQQVVEQPASTSRLVGNSAVTQELLKKVSKLAKFDSTALLTGESGTGKTTIARLIHDQGPRSGSPFIAVNCASLPRDLIEAELFGHVKGAFTGATTGRPGRAEIAAGGTLFLDEIGDLPLELQPKLLTFLQEKTLQRIGSNKTVSVDVRLIAATHQDLFEMCNERRFRSDLYYRLNVLQIEVPTLRERRADIPILAETIMDRIARRRGGQKIRLSPDAADALQECNWPGNIRELENVLERASAFCESEQIGVKDLELMACHKPPETRSPVPESHHGRTLKEIEKIALLDTLKANDGNKAMAARQLGISEKSIYNKLRRFELFHSKKK